VYFQSIRRQCSQPALVPNKPTPRHRYIQMCSLPLPELPLKGNNQNIEFVDNAPSQRSAFHTGTGVMHSVTKFYIRLCCLDAHGADLDDEKWCSVVIFGMPRAGRIFIVSGAVGNARMTNFMG